MEPVATADSDDRAELFDGVFAKRPVAVEVALPIGKHLNPLGPDVVTEHAMSQLAGDLGFSLTPVEPPCGRLDGMSH